MGRPVSTRDMVHIHITDSLPIQARALPFADRIEHGEADSPRWPNGEGSLMAANGKRRFGTVRRLPSGNWQVRYTGPDGMRRNDDNTYPDKTAALDRLVELEAEVLRGEWTDPEAGKVKLN